MFEGLDFWFEQIIAYCIALVLVQFMKKHIAANTLFTSVVARFNLRFFLVISELFGVLMTDICPFLKQ